MTSPPVSLELPEAAQVRLLCPDILVFDNVIPWGDKLIELAEKLQGWGQSNQIRSYTDQTFKSDFRTSRSQPVSLSVNEEWAPFEQGLFNAFGSAVKYYTEDYNQFLSVRVDEGYDLLKYEPGEKFEMHVDAVSGRAEGKRQLSGIAYLNDSYTGGETEFPRQGITVRAKAGDIILFPSDFCYPHTALPVLTGTKYSVVTWFS